MTLLEVFYLTGSVFFILFTVAIAIIAFYAVTALAALKLAAQKFEGLGKLLLKNTGKLQLGVVTFLLGLVRSYTKRR